MMKFQVGQKVRLCANGSPYGEPRRIISSLTIDMENRYILDIGIYYESQLQAYEEEPKPVKPFLFKVGQKVIPSWVNLSRGDKTYGKPITVLSCVPGNSVAENAYSLDGGLYYSESNLQAYEELKPMKPFLFEVGQKVIKDGQMSKEPSEITNCFQNEYGNFYYVGLPMYGRRIAERQLQAYEEPKPMKPFLFEVGQKVIYKSSSGEVSAPFEIAGRFTSSAGDHCYYLGSIGSVAYHEDKLQAYDYLQAYEEKPFLFEVGQKVHYPTFAPLKDRQMSKEPAEITNRHSGKHGNFYYLGLLMYDEKQLRAYEEPKPKPFLFEIGQKVHYWADGEPTEITNRTSRMGDNEHENSYYIGVEWYPEKTLRAHKEPIFLFQVGQKVVRKNGGEPVTIVTCHEASRQNHDLLFENRYGFYDSGYRCQLPESDLQAYEEPKLEPKPFLFEVGQEVRVKHGACAKIVKRYSEVSEHRYELAGIPTYYTESELEVKNPFLFEVGQKVEQLHNGNPFGEPVLITGRFFEHEINFYKVGGTTHGVAEWLLRAYEEKPLVTGYEMSSKTFLFEVGQKVLRIDETGESWGEPVTITRRRFESLPAHNIFENRYCFMDGGAACERSESSLVAYKEPAAEKPFLFEVGQKVLAIDNSCNGPVEVTSRVSGYELGNKRVNWYSLQGSIGKHNESNLKAYSLETLPFLFEVGQEVMRLCSNMSFGIPVKIKRRYAAYEGNRYTFNDGTFGTSVSSTDQDYPELSLRALTEEEIKLSLRALTEEEIKQRKLKELKLKVLAQKPSVCSAVAVLAPPKPSKWHSCFNYLFGE
jgi:hypothetical protein